MRSHTGVDTGTSPASLRVVCSPRPRRDFQSLRGITEEDGTFQDALRLLLDSQLLGHHRGPRARPLVRTCCRRSKPLDLRRRDQSGERRGSGRRRPRHLVGLRRCRRRRCRVPLVYRTASVAETHERGSFRQGSVLAGRSLGAERAVDPLVSRCRQTFPLPSSLWRATRTTSSQNSWGYGLGRVHILPCSATQHHRLGVTYRAAVAAGVSMRGGHQERRRVQADDTLRAVGARVSPGISTLDGLTNEPGIDQAWVNP